MLFDRTAPDRASPQEDLRLSDPPYGKGTADGARTHDRRVPADFKEGFGIISTVPLSSHSVRRAASDLLRMTLA
ncbi:hypothetical protein PoB_000814800 [Plakobranchus ocellatus]|uniref:Uncharacterized protein n=1 Tax=Plakobranchus ocellatus TaxID=259542 RepID=A0AAV3YGX2_9GAST|nr:hypothetical protein PoB_000814800 [Plakobranchus ocellatus]